MHMHIQYIYFLLTKLAIFIRLPNYFILHVSLLLSFLGLPCICAWFDSLSIHMLSSKLYASLIGSIFQCFHCYKHGQVKALPQGPSLKDFLVTFSNQKRVTLYDFCHIHSQNALTNPCLERKICQTWEVSVPQVSSVWSNVLQLLPQVSCFKTLLRNSKEIVVM